MRRKGEEAGSLTGIQLEVALGDGAERLITHETLHATRCCHPVLQRLWRHAVVLHNELAASLRHSQRRGKVVITTFPAGVVASADNGALPQKARGSEQLH